MSDREAPQRSRWQAFRGWPRGLRWTAYAAAGLVLVLVACTVAAVYVVRRPLPETDGELTLPGLEAEVTVVRDDFGIPRIYADTTADLMRAQGYVHAQDRFYEMDVRRHVTAGRLSELFGRDGLAVDRVVRTMGWRRVAQRELALIRPDTRAALRAYADGVNAFLAVNGSSEIAVEYTLLRATGLDYEPEPWTPVDSLAWLKAMAWDLRGNMEEEIGRALLAVDHTREQVAELYPPYPYDRHRPIVQGGGVVDGVFEQDARGQGTRNPIRPPWTADQVAALRRAETAVARVPALVGSGDGVGSNSWVVDGDHSATGAPLLANDPHLGVSQPGVWTQVGLHCRAVSAACPYDVSGFSFAGVPGVVIGHNADIAWGFTNLGPDVTDLYVERLRGDRWLYDGRYRPLRRRTEVIEVRGEEPVELTVRSTRHGPLLSDASDELAAVAATGPTRAGVALAWTALQPAATADAILALDQASDWEEFRAAARSFAVPAQNMVYADREGHIGYQAPGRVPIRKSAAAGEVPVAGWLPENDWTGSYVPFEALPSVLDPPSGLIVTANQAVTGRGYRYRLTTDWDYGYRAQRIRDLLVDEGELSVEEMTALQLDTSHAFARTLVPYLLDLELPPGYPSDGQRLLAGWDFTQPPDSGAAAYYSVVWDNLLRLAFHDEVVESQWPDGGGRWWYAVSRLLRRPASSWWDDRSTEDVVETRDDVLRQALLDARDELTRRQALDPDEWSWGRLHELELRNSTLGASGIGPVEALLNRGGWRLGGSGSVVNATGWDATLGYGVQWAPSMRMVVSLGDLDDSRWINLTGVSGHAASDHYDDQTDLYAAGETLPWAFTPDAVEATGEDVLTLVP